ncbi:succinate dehydrogenase iron-sulfur protein [Klebsiella pneumoniae]|uniref:succinate dehydrogenase n=1 Tax=Klebsiella pneumoniae TaxID=573 RepID=A0A2X3ETD2_KLEPN|nr:succinate dehydrogenase iron-sulfur protein [Klebsiella pneumoniae]
MMLLDALIQLKEKIRRCRSAAPAVKGSAGPMSEHEREKRLACITPISALNQPGKKIVIRPLPGLPVIRDLVVDMGQFYAQYEKIKPYLLNNGQNPPAREHLQMPEQREKLDGLYECILVRLLFDLVPVVLVEPGQVHRRPGCLLAAYRFLIDSRDTETSERLDGLSDAFSVFRCHSIMNCVSVCPKGLNRRAPSAILSRCCCSAARKQHGLSRMALALIRATKAVAPASV